MIEPIKLPPLPEWSKMDDLNGLVPSEIRQHLIEYATAAIEADRQARGEPVAWIRVAGDRVIASRCKWIYPQSTDDYAGTRDERRYAAIGGRDGDIVVFNTNLGETDLDDLRTMLAWQVSPQPAEPDRGEPVGWEYLYSGDWIRTTEPDVHVEKGRKVRALYASPQSQQIPEGYRLCLIPKEGTDAFNAACSIANQESMSGTGPCGVFIAGLRAMLEAAPEVKP